MAGMGKGMDGRRKAEEARRGHAGLTEAFMRGPKEGRRECGTEENRKEEMGSARIGVVSRET